MVLECDGGRVCDYVREFQKKFLARRADCCLDSFDLRFLHVMVNMPLAVLGRLCLF